MQRVPVAGWRCQRCGGVYALFPTDPPIALFAVVHTALAHPRCKPHGEARYWEVIRG